MARGFLAARLGAIATTLGFGGIREEAATDKHLDVAAAAKGGMRIVAPMAVVAGMIWALHAAAGRLPPRDPMLLRQTVAFPEFGVQVTFPYTWSVNHSRGETHFAARDATTGAVLSGEIAVTEPSKPLAAEIDRIVEQQRARLGPERKSSRGVMAFGLVYAEWAELSYDGLGNPLYIKTIALRRGNRVLALTCNGADQAQTACGAAIMPTP
jgi:hypothetical protein